MARPGSRWESKILPGTDKEEATMKDKIIRLLKSIGIALLCVFCVVGITFAIVYARTHPIFFWIIIGVMAFMALVGYIYNRGDF